MCWFSAVDEQIMYGILLPVGWIMDEYVAFLLDFVKKHLKIDCVVFDRGFTLSNFKINITIFLAKYGRIYPKEFDKFESVIVEKGLLG